MRKSTGGKNRVFIFQLKVRQRDGRGGRRQRKDTWRDNWPCCSSSSRPEGNLSRQYPTSGLWHSRRCRSAQLRRYLTKILSADPHRSLSVLGFSPAPHPLRNPTYIFKAPKWRRLPGRRGHGAGLGWANTRKVARLQRGSVKT